VFVFEAIGDADILRLEYIRSFDDPVIPERVVEYIIRVDGLNLDGARLCEALAESFPPQCGGAEIVIANPEMLVVDLEQEQSIRWTNDRVQLVGTYDGSQFMLNQ
jgi:hypothetical protein